MAALAFAWFPYLIPRSRSHPQGGLDTRRAGAKNYRETMLALWMKGEKDQVMTILEGQSHLKKRRSGKEEADEDETEETEDEPEADSKKARPGKQQKAVRFAEPAEAPRPPAAQAPPPPPNALLDQLAGILASINRNSAPNAPPPAQVPTTPMVAVHAAASDRAERARALGFPAGNEAVIANSLLAGVPQDCPPNSLRMMPAERVADPAHPGNPRNYQMGDYPGLSARQTPGGFWMKS